MTRFEIWKSESSEFLLREQGKSLDEKGKLFLIAAFEAVNKENAEEVLLAVQKAVASGVNIQRLFRGDQK